MPLIILAQITAAPGKEDFLGSELEKLVAPTRAEEGCVQYDLHRDNGNPGFFVFYEIWENRDLWQASYESAAPGGFPRRDRRRSRRVSAQ